MCAYSNNETQIIGAPAFFPTVWGWIKRWFDPVTTSKIFILSGSEVKPTLTKFMDPSSFPKQYGGELDWQWGSMPDLDEPARAVAGALERIGEMGDKDEDDQSQKGIFLKGPVSFKGDRIEIYGSVKGEPRRRTLAVPPHEPARDTVPPSGRKSEDDSGLASTLAAANLEDEKVVQVSQDGQANGAVPVPPQTASA